MSVVTNVILSFSVLENIKVIDNQLIANEVNLISIDDEKLPSGWYGGSKFMEANLYIGAVNGFDIKDYLWRLNKIDWECKGEVQFLVKGEDDDLFKSIPVFPLV